jgi:hypothetical protein
MGGAHVAICRPRGGFAKQKLYKKPEHQAKRACKEQRAKLAVGGSGTQKNRSDCRL